MGDNGEVCGIAGIAGHSLSGRSGVAIQTMVASLARRGPDAEGVWRWPEATLGHRRLAILDLSDAGKQPMITADGQVGLVFNGCVYNFQELRSELQRQGHVFHSQTDTEVLLLGYEQWGIDALVTRLRGMFAFGIWDNRKRQLFLVRDRLGVKPLLYAVRNGEIAFASTAKALQEAGFVGEMDPEALLEFLEFGWVSDDRVIYQGARKVPAATIVEWKDGEITERCYWTPPQAGSCRLGFAEAVEQTEELLLQSVKMRLIADVPVGTLLSGGIDSALIAWALSKLKADLRSFTVSTPGHPADESGYAKETANQLGVPHEIISFSESEQPDLGDLISAYGEPFACSSALAMLRVCKAVKPKVTVLLTGDGGDDVFLGYEHHRRFLLAQRIARLTPSILAKQWPAARRVWERISALRRPMHLVDYAVGGLGAVTRMHDGLPYYEQAGMLGERLEGFQLTHRGVEPSFDSAQRLMDEFLEYERRSRFVSEYMTKVDGAAMYYAMEARSPFLDQGLWEFAASLPVEMRLRRWELKSVLRAVARKNIGPEVAARKKQGFTVPVWHWLAHGWKAQLKAITTDSVLEQDHWLKKGSLASAVRSALDRGQVPLQLWYLVVLEHWLRSRAAVAMAP